MVHVYEQLFIECLHCSSQLNSSSYIRGQILYFLKIKTKENVIRLLINRIAISELYECSLSNYPGVGWIIKFRVNSSWVNNSFSLLPAEIGLHNICQKDSVGFNWMLEETSDSHWVMIACLTIFYNYNGLVKDALQSTKHLVMWSWCRCLATCLHLQLIVKHPTIIWGPFAIFFTDFPKKSMGKLAGKVTSCSCLLRGLGAGWKSCLPKVQKQDWDHEDFSSILAPRQRSFLLCMGPQGWMSPCTGCARVSLHLRAWISAVRIFSSWAVPPSFKKKNQGHPALLAWDSYLITICVIAEQPQSGVLGLQLLNKVTLALRWYHIIIALLNNWNYDPTVVITQGPVLDRKMEQNCLESLLLIFMFLSSPKT